MLCHAPDFACEKKMENMIALAQHALGQYGLRGAALHFVRHNENAIFRVQAPTGEAYVLRLHIHDASLSEDALMHRPRWLKSEMRFIQLLSQDGGLGVQRPLLTLEGTLLATLPDRQGYASMLSWVSGEPLNPADARLEARAYTVGELTARLHSFVLAHPETSRLVRPRYDARRVGKAVEKLHAGVVMGLFSHSTYVALQEGAVRICALMERELRRVGAHGLVHSDLGLSNLIADGNRVYPIDFGLCGHGPLLFDLGGLMGAFDEPAQRQAVLEGYTAHRPLAQADGAGIEAFFLASVYFFMAMHLGDPRVWEWFDRRLPVIVQAYLCPFTKGEPFLPGLLGRQAWQSAEESAVSGARAIDKK